MRIAPVLVVLVASLGGCEIDKPAPPPFEPPQQRAPRSKSFCGMGNEPQIIDVKVLEYGTKEPISDVTVQLARPPGQATSLVTNDDGRAFFDLSTENWQVAHISDPDYLTSCPPAFDDNEWHHPLVFKESHRNYETYTCLLVPRKALVVKDKARAIRLAKANAEVAPWLRNHPDARVVRTDLRGAHWEVLFMTSGRDSVMRWVFVDALDQRTRADYATAIPLSIDYRPYGWDGPVMPGEYYTMPTSM